MSYFRLFMQLFTCYAAFFQLRFIFSKLFGHCDKSNIWLADSYIIGSEEALNRWNHILDSSEHLGDGFSLLLQFFSFKKLLCLWDFCVCCPVCPRSCWFSYLLSGRVRRMMLLSDTGRQRKRSRCHQQLPPAWIYFIFVLQSVQALAECS